MPWEHRDQTDEAEKLYNEPLRTKKRLLEEENRALKRLLRENSIDWQGIIHPNPTQPLPSRITRSCVYKGRALPHMPVEIVLKILSYALTSPQPILDPLCKLKPERMVPSEKCKFNNIAIHFLATCRAYHNEGTRLLWSNNAFIFTSPTSLQNFAELDLVHRQRIRHVTFRIVAQFYDDVEDRVHRLPASYHHSLRSSIKLPVQRRHAESPMEKGGFRSYAWYQLIDFLEAMLPPYDPAHKSAPTQPRPRLLPALETLRIDFVNFLKDFLPDPPNQLHQVAMHQLGCTLNEVIATGLPRDPAGLLARLELTGLLRHEGIFTTHAPTLVAVKDGLRPLHASRRGGELFHTVARAMPSADDKLMHYHTHNGKTHGHFRVPPAAPYEGEPPFSDLFCCRTIWKKVPTKLDLYGTGERRWEMFDRVTGDPWETAWVNAVFGAVGDDGETVTCANCGKIHEGALPAVADMEGSF
ncbi:hypothetical protein F5Y14DRAFT_459530 [Nemania sp. NC0429]|nr:hypothetical protein F5Y14DRAFT_459530 [Nemania sp. NC0429]